MAQINEETVRQIRIAGSKKRVKLKDGTLLPRLGQGTWYVGDDPHKKNDEIRALRLGVELGMNLIDKKFSQTRDFSRELENFG